MFNRIGFQSELIEIARRDLDLSADASDKDVLLKLEERFVNERWNYEQGRRRNKGESMGDWLQGAAVQGLPIYYAEIEDLLGRYWDNMPKQGTKAHMDMLDNFYIRCGHIYQKLIGRAVLNRKINY